MEDNQQTNINWQDVLNKGNASEASRLYVLDDNSAEATRDNLELLVQLQRSLREKNVSKAKQVLSKFETTLEWGKTLIANLQPQLALLEEATTSLEKHDPDKTLERLASINEPLLLAEVETLRGTALIYHNKTSEAKQAFEKALELDPQHYRAMTNLGNLALEANSTDEAITLYERALKLNETFANAHHNLAVAYRKKGQVSKSVSELKKAQRVNQQKMREEARGFLKSSQTSKYLRWLLYAAAALILFLLLRSRL
jgi:tetratricopeptide (TPR) repeat protein